MSKIFSFNEKLNGSYIDSVSGQAGVNSNGVWKKTEKGMAWEGNGSDTRITLPSIITLSKNASTIVIWFKGWDAATNEFLIGDATSAFDYIGRVNGELRVEVGVNGEYWLRKTTTLENDKWYCLVVVSNNGTANSYLNGELIGTEASNYDLDLSYIGNYGTPNLGWKGHISKIELYNHAFSVQEITNLYKEFLRQQPTGTSIYKKDYPVKPTDLSRFKNSGLIAAYNMIPSPGGVLTDISGNGNNGTITGAISTKNGMKFDGVDDYVSISSSVNLGINLTINFRINPTYLDVDNEILGEKSNVADWVIRIKNNAIFFKVGAISDFVLFDFIKGISYTISIIREGNDGFVYVNGSLAGTLEGFGTSIPTLFDTLGADQKLDTLYYGDIQDMQFYNKALTEQEIKDYHNQFVKPVIIEDFKYDPVGSFPKEWKKGTGTYSIQESDGTDGLNLGEKKLVCSSAGTTAIQSDVAYGEWKFDFCTTGQNYFVFIIADGKGRVGTQNGYRFTYGKTNNVLFLTKETAGSALILFSTDSNYVSLNTWYGIKIIRTIDGEFTVWIKGGDFGDTYQLVDVTGGSGTNPVVDNIHTESKYIVSDLDQNDWITNLKVTNGIKQI